MRISVLQDLRAYSWWYEHNIRRMLVQHWLRVWSAAYRPLLFPCRFYTVFFSLDFLTFWRMLFTYPWLCVNWDLYLFYLDSLIELEGTDVWLGLHGRMFSSLFLATISHILRTCVGRSMVDGTTGPQFGSTFKENGLIKWNMHDSWFNFTDDFINIFFFNSLKIYFHCCVHLCLQFSLFSPPPLPRGEFWHHGVM